MHVATINVPIEYESARTTFVESTRVHDSKKRRPTFRIDRRHNDVF